MTKTGIIGSRPALVVIDEICEVTPENYAIEISDIRPVGPPLNLKKAMKEVREVPDILHKHRNRPRNNHPRSYRK